MQEKAMQEKAMQEKAMQQEQGKAMQPGDLVLISNGEWNISFKDLFETCSRCHLAEVEASWSRAEVEPPGDWRRCTACAGKIEPSKQLGILKSK